MVTTRMQKIQAQREAQQKTTAPKAKKITKAQLKSSIGSLTKPSQLKQIPGPQSTHNQPGARTAPEFCCTICLEMLVTPVQTACGHWFCCRCIELSTLRAESCPLCRASIRGAQLKPLPEFEAECRNYWLGSQQAREYRAKVQADQKWLAQRRVPSQKLVPGYRLDVRGSDHVWYPGEVIKVMGNQVKVKIENFIDDLLKFDTVAMDSERLAGSGLFSKESERSFRSNNSHIQSERITIHSRILAPIWNNDTPAASTNYAVTNTTGSDWLNLDLRGKQRAEIRPLLRRWGVSYNEMVRRRNCGLRIHPN